MRSRYSINPIPSDTVRSARAMLGQNNFYLTVGDNWGTLMPGFQDQANSKEDTSQAWLPPALTLGTLLQFKERLTDRQAEEASRRRVDWKYALHLPMYYPGLPRPVLCQFRQQVYHNPAWQQDLQSVLGRFANLDPFFQYEHPNLTALTLVDLVCSQSRLEEILLALRCALEALALAQSHWLRENIQPEWYVRYHLFNATPDLPRDLPGQIALSLTIGADILVLLDAISRSNQPELEALQEIQALRHTWSEQFSSAQQVGAQRLARCSFCGSLNAYGEKSG